MGKKENQLVQAVRDKNFIVIEELLDSDVDVAATNSDGISAIDCVGNWSPDNKIAILFAKKIQERNIVAKKN